MTKAIAKTYDKIHEYRRQVAGALFLASALVVVWYVVNLYAVISQTVALGKIESRMTEVAGVTSELDAQYLELSSALTPDKLSRFGFTEGKVTAFIPRAAATASLGRPLAASGHEF